YRPDGPDFLTIWEAYEVPEDSRKNARCYIGPNPNIKRGVAGECFCENKDIIVAHSTNQVDRHHNWIFDQESYIHFGRPGTHPAFVSFICIPVFVDKANMLGVLCFDSGILTAFDNLAMQKFLHTLGQITAQVII